MKVNLLRKTTSQCKILLSTDSNTAQKTIYMRKIRKLLNIFAIAIMGNTMCSCSEDIDVQTETNISYIITMSPDLLKFVIPQVSYVDENGVLVTITGVEELDKQVLENSAEVTSGGNYAGVWSSTTITGTGYKCWTVNMKFKRLGFHSRMSVKYIRNDFTEDTTSNLYDFHHNINTNVTATKITKTSKGLFGGETIDVSAYADSHITLSNEYHYGDNVEDYLNALSTHPDKAGYYVDENGDITRKDEFEL